MKKLLPILFVILSVGLIIYGVSNIIRDNKNANSYKESNSVNEETTNQDDKKEEVEEGTVELAKEPNYDETKEEVTIYLFWGDGCPHCEEAKTWFNEIEPEYGKYFKIVDFEVWKNEENAKLMQDVANRLKEEADGVPFIVIGDTTYEGFADVYKNKILNTIFSEYEKTERVDVIKEIKD